MKVTLSQIVFVISMCVSVNLITLIQFANCDSKWRDLMDTAYEGVAKLRDLDL